MRVVDLSFPIRPHFRWKVAREVRTSHARGDLFESSVLALPCHAYTHVDAPRHFLPGTRAIAEMPVDQWMGEAAVVDLTHLGANAEVTAAELERHAGHVRAGDIALLRTDWPRRTSVDDARFWRDVGYDYPPDYAIRTMLFEPGRRVTAEDCTTHHVFFPAGITVVEYLTNLHEVGAPRCRFLALPLKLAEADGSPVRNERRAPVSGHPRCMPASRTPLQAVALVD